MSIRNTSVSRRAGRMRLSIESTLGRASQQRLRWQVEWLEERTLMSSGPLLHTTYIDYNPTGSSGPLGTAGPMGFAPAQVRKAYGIDSISVAGITGDGNGQTVAIVDAYDWPTAYADLKAFDLQFGLPDPPNFTKLNQDGLASPLPPTDPAKQWEGEEALDVEWVHSIAPRANIILVEANSSFTSDLIQAAVATAAKLPGVSVVSMSFGGSEDSATDPTINPIFTTPAGHTGVTFLASTGDTGKPGGYPAYSPNVLAVGGTSLFLNGDNSYSSEAGWDGSGGGVSTFEPKPAYQAALSYTNRSIPDVSFVADPNTGVAVYDSFSNGGATPWVQVGGTSLSAPCWGGLIAIVNQERLVAGDSILDGPTQTIPLLYGLSPNDFHDITTGNNGFPAGPGYDLVTGIGSPIAPSIVRDLAPFSIVVTVNSLPNVVEGGALTNIQVASFSDITGLLGTSAYTATIDWGDKTTPTTVSGAGIVDLLNQTYGVNASHTYVEEGSYTLTVVVSSTAGLTGQGTASLTVGDAKLTPNPSSFSGVEGARFSGVVGTFTDGNAGAPIGDFTASIDWADGKATPGTLASLGGGVFSVSGVHTYLEEGVYPLKVAVIDTGGLATSILSTGTIQDAPLTAIPASITAIAGATITPTVASFTDADPAGVVSDYFVTINWGDGSPLTTTANGALVISQGTRFDVQAAHVYKAAANNIPVTVTIVDGGGSQAVANSIANVGDAPISALPVSFTTFEGQTYNGRVATFTSSNAFATASDFKPPQINWGDGTPVDASGTIVDLGGGKFSVNGIHTFGEERATPYAVSVMIASKGGSTTQTTSSAYVNDAPITVTANAISGTAGQLISGVVALVTDTYSSAPLSDVSATISWGDGTSSPGTVSQPGGVGSPFVVEASHAFANAQTYTFSVTVDDVGGATAAGQANAVIADASLTVIAFPITTTEGGTYLGSVGQFTSGNSLATASQFIASIDWGDGTSTGGLLTPEGNGLFNVSTKTAHVYAEEGDYPITLRVISLGGNRALGASSGTVSDAPIVPVTASPITTVAGTTFKGVVGSFNEYANAPLSDFTATIDWGDGTTSAGIIAIAPLGAFSVSGSHIYASINIPNTPQVTVKDVGGGTGTFSFGVTVTDPPITATSSAISSVQGQPFNGTVATFTEPNLYVQASEFQAVIDWGDGSPPSAGVVSGSAGQFSVTGVHVYQAASPGYTFSVMITHGVGGSTATTTASAHVLVPISGAMSRLSDDGLSNTDGITNYNTVLFSGRAEPLTTVIVYAAPTSDPSALTAVGTATTDGSGHWTVFTSPLSDGVYTFLATMTDPATKTVVQSAALPVTPGGAPLVLATTGPTVASLSLDAQHAQLHVTFQTSPAGMYLGGLMNANNYVLAQPAGLGLSPLAATGITASPGLNGQIFVTVSYHSGKPLKAGSYVVTLLSANLIDLAGNILVEHHFVTFPQASNSPNPNYVAQINVSKSDTATAPAPYVSLAEQNAANGYSNLSQKKKVIRVPRFQVQSGVGTPVLAGGVVATATTNTAVPRPSRFRRKR